MKYTDIVYKQLCKIKINFHLSLLPICWQCRLAGVGKSSLIKQYVCGMSPHEIAPTIGASFSTFKIKLEDGKVKMQVNTIQLLSN